MRARRLRTGEVVEAFVASRRATNASERYVESLYYHLGKLLRCGPWLPATAEPLEAVLGALRNEKEPDRRLSVYTLEGTISAWKMLYSWAAERYGVRDVGRALRRPAKPRKLPRVLTADEIERVLWVNQRRPREYALLLLLMDAGPRIGEVEGLLGEDLFDDGQGPTLRMTGKTGDHVVPLLPETHRALRRLAWAGPLWVGRGGEALGLDALQKCVRRALERGGVSGGPHLLRHTFATEYVRRGGDLVSLREILGHARMATTERYLSLDVRAVREKHARFSPLAERLPEGRQLGLFAGGEAAQGG